MAGQAKESSGRRAATTTMTCYGHHDMLQPPRHATATMLRGQHGAGCVELRGISVELRESLLVFINRYFNTDSNIQVPC